MVGSERVEFVDSEPAGGEAGDLLTVGGGDGPGRGPSRGRIGLLAGAVVAVVVAALLVGRLSGGDAGRPHATPTPGPQAVDGAGPSGGPEVYGLIGLPPEIGDPHTMVTAGTGDVVWMLDRGAGIVRLENGRRTAETLLEAQVTAIAVSPDGDRLYAATGGSAPPAIEELDATTLAPGRSRPTDSGVSALAVSSGALWATSGNEMLQLDPASLDTLATVVMPGVAVTDHLRVQYEQGSDTRQYVVGLVTIAADDGTVTTRFVRIDPGTLQFGFGPAIAHDTDVATGHYLTWVTTSGADPVTEGFAGVLDATPQAVATPALAAGSQIWDGGGGFAAFFSVAPHSSVISCHEEGGFAPSEIDVAPSVHDAVITGQVLRTAGAFYAITDRGLVRAGIGACA